MDGREAIILEFQKKAGLKTRQRSQRFSNFNVKPGHEDAYKAAQDLAGKCIYGDIKTGLLMVGPVGCGKTHLAASIANYMLDKWRMSADRLRDVETGFTASHYRDNPPRIVFAPVVSMLEEIRASYDSRESTQDIIETYAKTGLLILDDLGTEKMTEWANERLFEIIDHRYCEELPTVITTNLTPGQLKKVVGDRIYDRIREMCHMVSITEESQRLTATAIS